MSDLGDLLDGLPEPRRVWRVRIQYETLPLRKHRLSIWFDVRPEACLDESVVYWDQLATQLKAPIFIELIPPLHDPGEASRLCEADSALDRAVEDAEEDGYAPTDTFWTMVANRRIELAEARERYERHPDNLRAWVMSIEVKRRRGRHWSHNSRRTPPAP